MPQSLCRRVLDCYHFNLNHPGGSRVVKTIREACYWKGLITQAELFTKTCKTFQQFKKRDTIYGHLPPNNITEIKPWDLVHLDLIGPYSKSIRQHHPGGAIIWKNTSLNCMAMIDPTTVWFEIFEIPMLNLNELTAGNDE